MKKKLYQLLACILAFNLVIASTGFVSVTVYADDEEEDYDDEEDEEEEDEEEEGIPAVENFTVTSIAPTSVDLKWDKVDDVDGYQITYNGKTVDTYKTKITIKQLKVNTKYTFKIRAYIFYEEDTSEEADESDAEADVDVDEEADEEEDEGSNYEYSEEYVKVTVTTLKKGESPKKVKITADSATSASSIIAQSDSTVTKVDKGMKAVKKVKATYSKKDKGVKITWAKNSKAKGYYVYRAEKTKKVKYKKIATVTKKAYTKNKGYVDKKGLKAKQTYMYIVVGYKNKKTVSPDSNIAKVKISKK